MIVKPCNVSLSAAAPVPMSVHEESLFEPARVQFCTPNSSMFLMYILLQISLLPEPKSNLIQSPDMLMPRYALLFRSWSNPCHTVAVPSLEETTFGEGSVLLVIVALSHPDDGDGGGVVVPERVTDPDIPNRISPEPENDIDAHTGDEISKARIINNMRGIIGRPPFSRDSRPSSRSCCRCSGA